MTDFRAMTSKQAQAFMEAWTATTPARQDWLNEAMTADGEPQLQTDVASLIAVGEWLCTRAKLREGVEPGGRMPDLSGIHPDQAPMWYDGVSQGAVMFDDWTMWAIDAAALNFGHVVTSLYPEVKWAVAHERVKNYIDQNEPCLVSPAHPVPQNPVSIHTGMLFRYIQDATPAAESIQQAVDRLTKER